MKKMLVIIYRWLLVFGIDPQVTLRSLKCLQYYIRDLRTLRFQEKNAMTKFSRGKYYPCLNDRFAASGCVSGHYFHQDLLVARRIHCRNPKVHVDVGSRIDGFVAHVASFRPVQVIDIRPLANDIPNINFKQGDLMAKMSDEFIECCDSLSCLHALEHFGLGRYGDPVNYEGYALGLNNLWMMLKKDGVFFFSVPIGPQRIEFNAHRVFSIQYLLKCFEGKFCISCFSYIDDLGHLHENVILTDELISSNCNCLSGCGIFEMIKIDKSS